MISVRSVQDVNVDFKEVVSRSPVAGRPNALQSLLNFTKTSAKTFIGYIDGEVACIYGLMPPSLMSNRVYLWLLTTETAVGHKFLFIRHSQVCVEEILKDFDMIVGDVVIGDERAMRWMRWLGATFAHPENGLIPFHITKDSFKARRWLTQQH